MEENQEGNQVLFLKVSLYLMSLWILMFMLLVLKVDVSCFSFKMTKEDVIYSLRHNVIPLMCIGLSLLGGIGYLYFKDCLENAKGLPVVITECKSANYENLSFLATYIIPLVCFPMENKRQIFVLFGVILIIGCIFVKTNLFYTNPSLALLGFNIYIIKVRDKAEEQIVICRGKLKKDDKIKGTNLGDDILFVRKIE